MGIFSHVFFYGGESAKRLAKNKVSALGGDAAALTPEEASKAGIKVPKTAPGSGAEVSIVVVAGKKTETPAAETN